MANTIRQGLPDIVSRMVNDDGTITQPWYMFLFFLWKALGAGNTQVNAKAILSDSRGGSPVAVSVPTVSPYTFTSTLFGNLLVSDNYTLDPATGKRTLAPSGSTIEFSRGGDWYLVGLGPQMVPVMAGDKVRVSWLQDFAPPKVVFFPVV